MASITRKIEVSEETRKLLEELLWVFGQPEDCVMIAVPDGGITIENERRDHVLEISVKKKGSPPQFLGANNYQGNG
jgi:hypothetical protein